MRSHHAGGVEVRETVEQTSPDDGDEAGRGHQLGKARERRVRDFAAGDRPLEHCAHRRHPPLDDLVVIEFGQRRKACAFGYDEVRDVAPPGAVDTDDEQVGEAFEHGSDRQVGRAQLIEACDQGAEHGANQLLEQRLFVREMQIDRAFGDPRPVCDILEPRRRKASRGKFIKGGPQDRFPARGALLRAAAIAPPPRRRLGPMRKNLALNCWP